MGHTQYEPAYDDRRPWNAGRVVGTQKALKLKDVWAIRFSWNMGDAFAIEPCSTSPSTASCAAVIS